MHLHRVCRWEMVHLPQPRSIFGLQPLELNSSCRVPSKENPLYIIFFENTFWGFFWIRRFALAFRPLLWSLLKENFSKNWKWKKDFDQYFWQNMASWICRLSVNLFWSTKHANSVLIQNFQIMEGDQKMWSNCIFHFIFLEKFSFISEYLMSQLES